MLFASLPWEGPFSLPALDIAAIPSASGVYVFTESGGPLRPNPRLPPPGAPDYEAAISRMRNSPCVLYVGKATTLSSRLPGYRFRPYLEIRRRPAGSAPRHEADRHKGRALLHAHQFFDGNTFVRWAQVSSPGIVEAALIRELRPALNTMLMDLA